MKKRTLAYFMSALLFTSAASAALHPPVAPSATNGNYTVVPSGCGTESPSANCNALWIEERTQAGNNWESVDGTFSDKPPGTYEYRTGEVSCNWNSGAWYGVSCAVRYSSAIVVLVTPGELPSRESLELQRTYQYVVRHGNVIGNSQPELLIERTSGPSNASGVIDAVLLQQINSGEFQAIVPDSTQRNSSIWQTSAVSVIVDDINADGYVDLALQGVSRVLPAAQDQIIFASGDPFEQQPQAVRAFDNALQQFTENLLDYMGNERYFTDNAQWGVSAYTHAVPLCPSSFATAYSGSFWGLPCFTIFFTSYRTTQDYSAFADNAVAIWQDEAAVSAGRLAADTATEQILERIESVFEVSVGGWDMREIFGEGPGIDDPVERRGLEGFLAILGIGTARADEIAPEDVEAQGVRDYDVIHIVGRYVFGRGWDRMHTAVLYRHALTGLPTWYSGFDSDDSWLKDGTLVAKTNAPADSPLLMRFTLGEVVPPASRSRSGYFLTDMLAAHNHYRNLPNSQKARYDAIPEFPCGGCNGRNSNGYVNGLIGASHGRARSAVGFNFLELTGWEYPVEAHYFGR